MMMLKTIKNIGWLISILLFLFLVNPYGLSIYFGYLITALILIKKDFLLKNLDSTSVLLLLFSLTYAAFYSFNLSGGVQYIFVYATFPLSFYLLGKYIFEKLKANETNIFYFLFFIGLTFSITPLVSVLLNIIKGGFGQLDRSLPLIWTGSLVAATIMGSFFSFNMVIPGLLLIKKKKTSIFFQLFQIAIFILTLACVLRIGSRTQLGVCIITLFCSLAYIVPRQSLKKNITLFSVIFVLILIIATNVSLDFSQDYFSTFASRMDKGGASDIASGGGRSDRWMKSIENLFTKPLGWSTSEFGHSHNLWLDVLRVSGIIPFFLLIVFSFRSFFSIISAIKNNPKKIHLNNMLLIYYISISLVFMVEPIFEGMFDLFSIFCLLNGVTYKYRLNNSK